MNHRRLLYIMACLCAIMSSCKKDTEPTPDDTIKECSVISFTLKADNNPLLLQEDVSASITDGKIDIYIPYLLKSKLLVPDIQLSDSLCKTNITKNDTIDLTTDKILYVYNNKNSVINKYTIHLKTYTGLPVIYINTYNKESVKDKENYVKGTLQLCTDGYAVGSSFNFDTCGVQIKYRGNSTLEFKKRPYRIKFEEEHSMLGMHSDRDWVLLANYLDHTQLRNALALTMGQKSTLDWTPQFAFVELFLNDQYQGLYQLVEKIEINKHKVNVGNEGYLMEIDSKRTMGEDEKSWFETPKGLVVNVKEPDMDVESEKFKWIKDYITEFENVLYSDNFLDPVDGYANYVDKESFAEWYLINEITKNTDAIMWSSCFMNIIPGEKLKMGPIWDFDLSCGNSMFENRYSPEDWYVKTAQWFERMFLDPEFVTIVQNRYSYFRKLSDFWCSYLNNESTYIDNSIYENNMVWGTLYQPIYSKRVEVSGSFKNEVQFLKNWLNDRFIWMDKAITDL